MSAKVAASSSPKTAAPKTAPQKTLRVAPRRTYSAKPADITRQWYVLDASVDSLGRVATKAAALLLGKGKPQVTSHIDCGDYVIIINAKDLVVTGNKLVTKKYYRHSGYAGNLRERSLQEQLNLDPTKVIEAAVRGMLPTNKLLAGRLERLKIYAGAEHKHEAQKPETLSLKGTK